MSIFSQIRLTYGGAHLCAVPILCAESAQVDVYIAYDVIVWTASRAYIYFRSVVIVYGQHNNKKLNTVFTAASSKHPALDAQLVQKARDVVMKARLFRALLVVIEFYALFNPVLMPLEILSPRSGALCLKCRDTSFSETGYEY